MLTTPQAGSSPRGSPADGGGARAHAGHAGPTHHAAAAGPGPSYAAAAAAAVASTSSSALSTSQQLSLGLGSPRPGGETPSPRDAGHRHGMPCLLDVPSFSSRSAPPGSLELSDRGPAAESRPPPAGMRGAFSWGVGPNAYELDGRPGTRGGSNYELDGRPGTRSGQRPPSRMLAGSQGTGSLVLAPLPLQGALSATTSTGMLTSLTGTSRGLPGSRGGARDRFGQGSSSVGGGLNPAATAPLPLAFASSSSAAANARRGGGHGGRQQQQQQQQQRTETDIDKLIAAMGDEDVGDPSTLDDLHRYLSTLDQSEGRTGRADGGSSKAPRRNSVHDGGGGGASHRGGSRPASKATERRTAAGGGQRLPLPSALQPDGDELIKAVRSVAPTERCQPSERPAKPASMSALDGMVGARAPLQGLEVSASLRLREGRPPLPADCGADRLAGPARSPAAGARTSRDKETGTVALHRSGSSSAGRGITPGGSSRSPLDDLACMLQGGTQPLSGSLRDTAKRQGLSLSQVVGGPTGPPPKTSPGASSPRVPALQLSNSAS